MDEFNLSHYQQILFQTENENISKANIQRKNLVQMVKPSYRSSNNFSCHLLEARLKEYSNAIEYENLYNKSLKHVLRGKNRQFPVTFKSNLDMINTDPLVKSLPCSNKNHCFSVNLRDADFNEFYDNISIKKSASNKQTSDVNKATIVKTAHMEVKYTQNYPRKYNVDPKKNLSCDFKTAKEELHIQNMKKAINSCEQPNRTHGMGQKRKLGTRRNVNSKFISPLLSNNESQDDIKSDEWSDETDERLKNLEPKMVELIRSEIMDCGPNIHWDDIAGLSFAKAAIQEAVVWPMLRPDIFTGLRRPPKGILLFGPPGTGKTLIGKCVASQSKSTFFSISASSLTSKWVGDGEKMVRALFVVARIHQPSVIFIDEIDSLLSQRSDTEHESSRRIKTEFLVQLDGATTDNEERILVIGATNRPQELDEAARRRFVKRLYIPLPELEARLQLVQKLMLKENHQLHMEHFDKIAALSNGYSGADIRNLCSEASLGPIRAIDVNLIEHIQAAEVRPLVMEDFEKAFTRVRSSVSPKDLEQYVAWDKTYGSGSGV